LLSAVNFAQRGQVVLGLAFFFGAIARTGVDFASAELILHDE